MPIHWAVVPTCLPRVVRRCHACTGDRFRTTGKFRVNANHKLLDAWILALCEGCGDTTKLTVFERTHVRSVRHELLDRLHHNDPRLAAEVLQDATVQRRNRITLDWDGAWRLDTGPPLHRRPAAGIDVRVCFAARIPVRPVRIVAEGLALPRAEVERLLDAGGLVSTVPLRGRRANDFAFTLRR